MHINEDYTEGWNVRSEMASPTSVYSFWKDALAARKAHDVLVYGDFAPLDTPQEKVLAYRRSLQGSNSKASVFLNFGEEELEIVVEDGLVGMKLLLDNYHEAMREDEQREGAVKLRAYEGKLFIG
jgi:alpha-glucosidase